MILFLLLACCRYSSVPSSVRNIYTCITAQSNDKSNREQVPPPYKEYSSNSIYIYIYNIPTGKCSITFYSRLNPQAFLWGGDNVVLSDR